MKPFCRPPRLTKSRPNEAIPIYSYLWNQRLDQASPCSTTVSWFSLLIIAPSPLLVSCFATGSNFLARNIRCSGVRVSNVRLTVSLPVGKSRKTQEARTKGKVKTGRLKVARMGERAEWRSTVTRTANRCTGRDLGGSQFLKRRFHAGQPEGRLCEEDGCSGCEQS